jgi:hypothetical protein
MASPRALAASLLAIAAVLLQQAQAQTPAEQLNAVEQQVASQFQIAPTTPDGRDLTEAGSVLVLQKDSIVMNSVAESVAAGNIYSNGKVQPSGLAGGAAAVSGVLNKLPGFMRSRMQVPTTTSHTFKAGEKFFVTAIVTKPDGVQFMLMSDVLDDGRYRASLKFPFPKGVIPSGDDVLGQIAEVLKLDEPPPPEPPPPPTITAGMSRDEVIATLGVPRRIVKVGPKEIDFFQDLKVTFIRGQVVNVE